MYNISPILGRGHCPHCGDPVSTALPLWIEHMERCSKNPDNTEQDNTEQENTNQDKNNMERINKLDFDPIIITKKDVTIIGAATAALTALAAFTAYKTIKLIRNKIKG